MGVLWLGHRVIDLLKHMFKITVVQIAVFINAPGLFVWTIKLIRRSLDILFG